LFEFFVLLQLLVVHFLFLFEIWVLIQICAFYSNL
jgi:hypothetical protein